MDIIIQWHVVYTGIANRRVINYYIREGGFVLIRNIRPDFFILWFTDIFGLYSMSEYGIRLKIKQNFVDVRLTFEVNVLINREKAYFETNRKNNYLK